MKRNFS